jgi:dTDP-4-amino-4,6-dideoxygalactose transaminase
VKEFKIPFVNLKMQYIDIKGDIDEAISRVLASGQFILGPEVKEFEDIKAAYCECKFAIGVASGTDALLLSMIALGIEPGDEVITSPFTFVATANTISRLGARPVFVDIDPLTYNIDPYLVEQKISEKTKLNQSELFSGKRR